MRSVHPTTSKYSHWNGNGTKSVRSSTVKSTFLLYQSDVCRVLGIMITSSFGLELEFGKISSRFFTTTFLNSETSGKKNFYIF